MSKINEIKAREILDSRGNPTLEVDVMTEDGYLGRYAVPSGASVGINEALELRDVDSTRFFGKGVRTAIQQVKHEILPFLKGFSIFDQQKIDQQMIALDGTPNKSRLGANAILGVSIAVAKAAAAVERKTLWQYLKHTYPDTSEFSPSLPLALMNIINGGLHADNSLDIQEFMIVPQAALFSERLQMGAEVFHHLKKILKKQGKNTNVGDEGGFAPNFLEHTQAIDTILDAIHHAGYREGVDITLALDVAASEFYNKKTKKYHFQNKMIDADTLIEYWISWVKQYPIFSIEDPLAQEDWEAWQVLTQQLGNKIQLVGDDLFVTQSQYLARGIREKVANSILIKVNQVGTLSETIDVINMAKKSGYSTIMSHRSGETEDTTIADLSVGLGTPQIKTGSLSRSDRTAKYNQLLRIEEEIKQI